MLFLQLAVSLPGNCFIIFFKGLEKECMYAGYYIQYIYLKEFIA